MRYLQARFLLSERAGIRSQFGWAEQKLVSSGGTGQETRFSLEEKIALAPNGFFPFKAFLTSTEVKQRDSLHIIVET